MKYLVCLVLLLVGLRVKAQSDSIVFSNPKDMLEYAFSNTNFQQLPSRFFTDFTLDLELNQYSNFFSDSLLVNSSELLKISTLLQWWDMEKIFNRDSIIYPLIDRVYSYSGTESLRLPIIVYDYNVASLTSKKRTDLKNHSSIEPYEAILPNEVNLYNAHFSGVLFDTLGTKDVLIEFDSDFIFSNTNRQIEAIIIKQGSKEITLHEGENVLLSELNVKSGLFEFIVMFSDNTSFKSFQNIYLKEKVQNKSLSDIWDGTTTYHFKYNENASASIQNPEAQFKILHACSDKKVRKPFIVVAGWGPHTDKSIINNNQEWPTNLYDLANQFNQEGLLENLHADGFDVIVVKFFPPNASVIKNAEALRKCINYINELKNQNDSYEENIIMGMSAGALATKLCLQAMEKAHLESNDKHPHTKLFISNDGENLGANIPLGLQHTVNYLWNYEYNFYNFKLYALNYILNAPLSKELLHYFHTETGSNDEPGQGMHPFRSNYLNYHTLLNHSKNSHLLGYPSFQRNISISNGSSTPNYDFSNFSSDHEPYPSETGHVFLKQTNSFRRWEATFLKHGEHRVFYFESKPLLFLPWTSIYEAKTKNPLVLDNAPGGIVFIKKNPLAEVIEIFDTEFAFGSMEIKEKSLFSFTPTIFTHDVRNLHGSLPNGYLNYNFKDKLLNFSNENDVNSNPQIINNFYGYPHLGYPVDHYNITPFDALFTWDQNTEHLIGDVKNPNADEGMWSPMKPVLKNFIVEEAEPFNIFLQNKRIGYFARPDYTYRVDYEAKNGIYVGNHVTQKTDFIDFIVETNAQVDMQAEKEIVFTDGVHIKAGSSLHAYIGETTCEKSGGEFLTNGNQGEEEVTAQDDLFSDFTKTDNIFLFPNPSTGNFSIFTTLQAKGTALPYQVLNVQGSLIESGIGENQRQTVTHLKPGIYLIRIKILEAWHTKKLIIE